MQRSVLALVMCVSRSVLCSSHDAISAARCRSREPEESLRVELQPAPSRSHHIPHLVNNRYKIMLARDEWTANCQWEVHRHDLLHVSLSDFPIDRSFPWVQFPVDLMRARPSGTLRGEMFLLLTDGITEVVNERDEEFGLARLEQLLCKRSTTFGN